jgi:hypothetical protein
MIDSNISRGPSNIRDIGNNRKAKQIRTRQKQQERQQQQGHQKTVETSGTEGRQTMGMPATAYNSGATTAERTSTTARSTAASETTGS